MILESALIIYLPKCTNIYNNAYPFICSYSGGNNFPISRKNLSDFYGNYRPNIRPNIRPDSAEYSVSADTSFYCIGRSLVLSRIFCQKGVRENFRFETVKFVPFNTVIKVFREIIVWIDLKIENIGLTERMLIFL